MGLNVVNGESCSSMFEYNYEKRVGGGGGASL